MRAQKLKSKIHNDYRLTVMKNNDKWNDFRRRKEVIVERYFAIKRRQRSMESVLRIIHLKKIVKKVNEFWAAKYNQYLTQLKMNFLKLRISQVTKKFLKKRINSKYRDKEEGTDTRESAASLPGGQKVRSKGVDASHENKLRYFFGIFGNSRMDEFMSRGNKMLQKFCFDSLWRF